MTPEEVKARLAIIKRIADVDHDDETAHGKEDALYEDVLKSIAKGYPNARKLARLALKTKEIKFARFMA